MNRCFFPTIVTLAYTCSRLVYAQAVPSADPRVIHFSGYDWVVRADGQGGPAANFWASRNVSVDGQGRLHLKISRQGDRWQCAQVSTRKSFGFGRYQFQVSGGLDRLDPNVVLGLFNYPAPSVGPDGTNEIDIEYSRWGRPTNPPVNFTVYPKRLGLDNVSRSFPMPPGLIETTERFTWQATAIRFQCLRGFRDDDRGEYARWTFNPEDPQHVPQQPLPVLINLWLTRAHPPHDGREVEVVVKSFSFTPATP